MAGPDTNRRLAGPRTVHSDDSGLESTVAYPGFDMLGQSQCATFDAFGTVRRAVGRHDAGCIATDRSCGGRVEAV